MKKLLAITLILTAGLLYAAELNISGQSNKTYDGGTYTKLTISNSSNITIKNCTFRANYDKGAVGSMDDACRDITIDNCEFDGSGRTCLVMGVKGTRITLKNCYFHSALDDGFEIRGVQYLKMYDNVVADLRGCGTDGGCSSCYNGHSDAFEFGNVQHAEFKRNFVYNVKSTSCFFPGNYNDTVKKNSDILLTNNIFYPHYCAYVIYLHYIDGVKLYNNTFWKGSKGGAVLCNTTKNLHARNNIFATVNLQLYGTTFDPANHDFDYNGHGLANQYFPLQAHSVLMPNPVFKRAPFVISDVYMTDPKPEDFTPLANSPTIGKGTSGGEIPATDFFGNPRTEPYDLGAIEYQGATGQRDMERQLATLTEVRIFPSPVTDKAEIMLNKSGVRPQAVSIVSGSGRIIREFTPKAGQRRIAWDTRDMNGVQVGEGVCYVNLVYKDRTDTRTIMVAR